MLLAPTSQPESGKTSALDRALEYFRVKFASHPKAFDTLCEIVDTCLVASHPLALGTVLGFVRSSNIVAYFRDWSEHCPEANALAELGEALSGLPLPDSLAPLADSKPGREHFFGGLNEHYLLALLAERIPSAEAAPQNWMLQLRAWLVLHAYLRYRRGIRLDENLQTIARSMRMACDHDAAWLQLFLRLRHPSAAKSFRELNFRLGTRARQLVATYGIPDKERKALRAISEISSDRDKQLKHATQLPALITKDQSRRERVEFETSTLELTGHNAELVFDSEHGVALVTEILPEGYTPAERKLSSRTVLLASAESMQLLPWSWRRPNPIETKDLDEWVRNILTSAPSASSNALAAAFLWTAIALGRSVTRMLALRIGNTVEAEWQFDPDRGIFKRQPPMRRPGWLPNDAALSWIEPTATEIVAYPPDTVRLALRKAYLRFREAGTLRELWPSGNMATPEQAINAILGDVSPRLTGAMLSEVLPQQTFELHQDAVLARLIASHPQSPLSGAHSYAQWRLDTVTQLLSGSYGATAPTANPQAIALGSRLAIIDHLIRDSIRKSRDAVIKARKTGNPIALHNAYTAYVVVALLAATGARPVRSPFESLAYFDFEAELVFIDDKHGGAQQRSGRIIPLVSGFNAFFQKRYLPHLRGLAGTIAKINPTLAKSIACSAVPSTNGDMPLFFFLEENGGWTEVSPVSLFHYAELDWPLPANLFRHRLPNRLRALGLDPEIIDGLLGHGEWSCETWGYLSFRTWKNDAAIARPALDKVFKALRFHPLRGLADGPTLPDAAALAAPLPSVRLFGAEARHRERRRRYFATMREAEFTIRDFLQHRELASIDSDELDILADRLTRTREGMPIPSGGLRLAYLIRKLERIEVQSGKRHRPKKERLLVNDPPSMFSEKAPGAQSFVTKMMCALDHFSPPSRSAQRLAAVLRLCVESRITDTTLLLDVAASRGYRLVRLGDRYYLEYGRVNGGNDVAGRRFRISSLTAEWLHHSSDARPCKPTDTLHGSLQALFRNLPTPPGSLAVTLNNLAQIVEQANALSFPGIICGVLAGKMESTALGWRDTTRLHCGRKIDVEFPQTGLETDALLKFRGQFTAADNAALRGEANRKLLGDIRRGLYAAEQAPPGTPNVRRSMRSALENAMREGIDQCASPALLLLAQWILHLARIERREAPRPVSLRRYWTALAWRFNCELPEFDLLLADEDELTEAYTRVLLSNEKQAGPYALERLGHFHNWLARTFDVETPAWEELPLALPGLGVSPGFIAPQEYLESFQQLLSNPAPDLETALSAALVLLLAYRFGLRRREALYLTRDDWEEAGERIVITVRANRWRRLKSEASRRQVPLVFSLTRLERETIARAMALYATRHGTNHCHLLHSFTAAEHVSSAIRQVLKQVTGNPCITLHHARHSAANLVALTATGIAPGSWNWPEFSHSSDIQLLGGKFSTSRRHAWAIARFLGHASPTTTCKSYLHFIFEWAESLLPIFDPTDSADRLWDIPRLDHLPELPAEPGSAIGVAETKHVATIQTILKAYRLHARQISPEAIAITLDHPISEVRHWLHLLKSQKGISRAGDIVATLSDPTWDRLVAWSASLGGPPFDEGPLLPPDALHEMVGEKRQLLAWRPEHFALLRFAVVILQISEMQYKLFGSAQLHAGTNELALAHGFTILERPLIRTKNPMKGSARRFQIDTAFVGLHREPVASRVAALYRENDAHAIRNQPQFALLVLICGICLSSPS